MKKLAIVTVVSRNYLAGARVLMNSVRAVAPQAATFICLADRPPHDWNAGEEPAECFFADRLSIPQWKRFAFRYQSLELACALKPRAMQHVLELGFEKVIYVDGDQYFYSRPDALIAALERDDVVLTPHLTSPLSVDRPSERDLMILRAGAYNAGLIGVRRSPTADRLLQWWAERLSFESVVDVHGGQVGDQRWLDLVPGLFSGVRIERSPGINAAFWTLWSHPLTYDDDVGYQIGSTPLVDFHFSGFDPQCPLMLSRHDPYATPSTSAALARLTSDYAGRLLGMGWAKCRAWGYEFERLRDGTLVRPYWREAVRLCHESLADIEDPFDTETHPDLVTRLSALEPLVRRHRVDWRLAEADAPPVRLNRWQRILRRYFCG